MKILFNRPIKRSAWGGGSHFITSLYEYLINKKEIEIVFDLKDNNIDLILIFDPRSTTEGPGIQEIIKYKEKNPSVKIIQRINDTDYARHAYGLSPHDKPWRTKLFLYANQFVDHTIFISNWVKNHYEKLGYQKKERSDSVIINGCNSNFFYPSKRLNLSESRKNNNKLKIITHHWSNNPMKGADVYKAIDQVCSNDPDISFTYIGRYPENYKPQNTTLVSPIYGKEIGDILRQHDLYITGARFESCGMHHLEGASCGLPVLYHKDGGAINEICKDHGREYFDLNSLIENINYFKNNENLIEYSKKINYNNLKGDICYEKYFKNFCHLLDKN